MGNKLNMGSLITRRREALELTREQMALGLGVKTKAVVKWEKGLGYPDITVLTKLADLLEVSVEELLAHSESEQQEPSEDLVANTFAYAGTLRCQMQSKVSMGFLIAVTALCGVGMFVCGLVDLVLNQYITWSVYPISSLAFSLAVLAPPLYVREKRFLTFLVSLSVCLLPFLKFILWRVELSVLFFTLAVPVTVLSLLYAWGVYLVAVCAPVNGWLKSAAIVGLLPLLSFGVNRVIAAALLESRGYSLDIFSVITGLAVAGVLLLVGLRQNNRG